MTESERQAASGEPVLWYLEEGRVVFTAAYHLRRGFCCGAGCRHCPFDEVVVEGADTQEERRPA